MRTMKCPLLLSIENLEPNPISIGWSIEHTPDVTIVATLVLTCCFVCYRILHKKKLVVDPPLLN